MRQANTKDFVGYITEEDLKPKKGFSFLGQFSHENKTYYTFKRKEK